MPGMKTIGDVVREGLCISCGACVVVGEREMVAWVYDRRRGQFVPRAIPSESLTPQGTFDICPGKGVELLRLANAVKSVSAVYDSDLGFVFDALAARSTEPDILKNASSGGIITGVARHLLSTGRVTGVMATRFVYGADGPRPESVIVRNPQTLQDCQGSKYCPVSIHEALMSLKGKNERIAFIGTPCQIAALRMMMERFDWLRESIQYVIGSFCGGMKDFRSLNGIIRRQGIEPADVTQFCFRGGGQPGRMMIADSHGCVKTRPYPDYETDTGFKKLERCRLCIDGTAELADIACGDAWLNRFLESGRSWSVAIVRNETGAGLLREMLGKGLIEIEEISLDEIKYSQKSNLSSKKKRQAARRRLYRLIGWRLPVYDGGFPETPTSLWLEIKVIISHSLLRGFETLGIYDPFIKFARWIRGTNEFKKIKDKDMTKKRKKILFVERCNTGGLANYAHEFCNAMVRQGHEVTLFCLGCFEVPPQHRSYNIIESSSENYATRVAKGMQNLKFALRAVAAIRDTNADAVFLDAYQPMLSWPFVFLRPKSVPVFCIQHEVEPRIGDIKISWFQQDFYRRTTALMVHRNTHARDTLVNKYGIRTPILVIDHGLYETDLFGKEAAGVGAGKGSILSFGTVREDKGLDILVKAYPGREKCKGLGLVIAGQAKGEYGEYFSKVVANQPDTRWDRNYISAIETGSLYRDAAFVVLPFIECTQSGTLRLAMFFETPVIASAVGELPAFIKQHQVGMLVPAGDVGALQEAIITLANDPAKRAQYVVNIRRLNSGVKLSWQKIVQELFIELEVKGLWDI